MGFVVVSHFPVSPVYRKVCGFLLCHRIKGKCDLFFQLAKRTQVMNTEENNQDGIVTNNDNGGGNDLGDQDIKLSKDEYGKLKAYESTVGSLKRELKDLKKSLEEKGQGNKEAPKSQQEEFGLLQKSYLRAASIVDADEVELAKTLSKKWGMELDVLVDDEDFKAKLEKLRTTKSNAKAVDVEGGSGGTGGAKNSTEYWSQKGELPSSKDVPDRATRAKIHREMAQRSRGGGGGKFYNE